ncbi:MAG: nucleotidyltransferase family protein [Pyrinomonadaceae bacterium]
MISKIPIEIPNNSVKEFCQRWKINELAIFGSALRSELRPESDLDILVSFAEDANWSIFDHARMSEELSALLGRKVDIVEAVTLNNPFRRHEILSTRQVIYAA